jgi:hypothetical protein
MKYDGLVGEIVHLVPAITFPFTVEQLGLRTPEMLAALEIDSGEHIAAILVSAFLGTVPAAVDLDGGVDLVFTNLSPRVEADVGCGEVVSSACFEVKSMRGDFRRFVNQRSTKIGDSHQTTIRSIADVVDDAQREIQRAAKSLRAKADSTQSRNIVIVVHSFEHLAIEAIESPYISHLLRDPGEDLADIASVWLVIYPLHAVRWERARQRWVNLGTGGAIDGHPDKTDSFGDVLVASEQMFCEAFHQGKESAWSVFHSLT